MRACVRAELGGRRGSVCFKARNSPAGEAHPLPALPFRPVCAASPSRALRDRGGLFFLEPKDDLEPWGRRSKGGSPLANTCVWPPGPAVGLLVGARTPRWSPATPTSLRAAPRARRGCSLMAPPHQGAPVPIMLPAGGAIGGGRSHPRGSLLPIRPRTFQPHGDPRSGAVARPPPVTPVQHAFHQWSPGTSAVKRPKTGSQG